MALWQYSFFIIPKYSLSNSSSKTISKSEEDELFGDSLFDDSLFWIPEKRSPSFFNRINDILKQGVSWSDKILLFGDQDSNRFEVLSEDDTVQSVSFRISFISDYEKTLREIIEFCILNSLLILDEELNICPLNFEEIKELIDNSSQLKKYIKLSKIKE